MIIVEFSLILRFLKSTFKNIFPIFQLSLSGIHFMIMAKIIIDCGHFCVTSCTSLIGFGANIIIKTYQTVVFKSRSLNFTVGLSTLFSATIIGHSVARRMFRHRSNQRWYFPQSYSNWSSLIKKKRPRQWFFSWNRF